MDIFNQLKSNLLHIDPVNYCEDRLTLDGEEFRLHGNGYKPFADIYRYIALKAIEKDGKRVVLVKGRQVGATTMAAALECYFMSCGLFGTNGRYPMRVMHCFPQLDIAYAYTKDKLDPMISAAKPDPNGSKGKNGKPRSYLEAQLDRSAPSNNSLQFKKFLHGNQIWIESTGLSGDRIRGRSVDCMMFDECFPYDQHIETEDGKHTIGWLYNQFVSNNKLPLVKTYNEKTEQFEYKEIINAWKKEERDLIQIKCGNRKIKCTENHKLLTNNGWKEAGCLKVGDLIKTTPNLYCKIEGKCIYGFVVVKAIKELSKREVVYDIEVKDNHNFIATSCGKKLGGLIAHNCQDIRAKAIANSTKTLVQGKYGKAGRGVQVFFGTPKQKGSNFHNMWKESTQQYYHLGCERCGEYFPLYTPNSNEWESIWLYGFIVRCPHCEKEQDKREAAERGKWISFGDAAEDEYLEDGTIKEKYIGFHINQLYIPTLEREQLIAEKPENNINNSETEYQNEVLGEFYSGDGMLLTPDDIDTYCADEGRKFRRNIEISDNKRVYLGCDWGKKVDTSQMVIGERKDKRTGQSYSCAVVLTVEGPERLSIEYATKLARNDPEYKKGVIEQMFRQYSISMAVGDIGYAGDLTYILQKEHPNFLASDARPHIKNKIKFVSDEFPNVIRFEKNYYIAELLDWLKKGKIRFPYGSYEQVAWLIEHCCSMEIKITMTRTGEPVINYTKGSTPNDGFMALLNAYLAYKYDLTKGFTVSHPSHFHPERMTAKEEGVAALSVYMPGMRSYGGG